MLHDANDAELSYEWWHAQLCANGAPMGSLAGSEAGEDYAVGEDEFPLELVTELAAELPPAPFVVPAAEAPVDAPLEPLSALVVVLSVFVEDDSLFAALLAELESVL